MATSVTSAEYLGVHHITRERAEEHFRAEGAAPARRLVPIPFSHVALRSTGRAALYDRVRSVVRVLVKTLWLYPLLLIPKAILWALNVWQGDLLTVAFVVLVVITFGGLSLLSLLHLLAGPRSEREAAARLILALPDGPSLPTASAALGLPAAELAGATLLEQLVERRSAVGPFRLRGTIDAGLSLGQPVLSERFVALEQAIVRVVTGSSFALRVEGAPLVAIELASSPVLLGPYRPELDGLPSDWPATAASVRLDAATLAGAPACVLRQGDVVEILAPSAEIVSGEPRFAKREGDPYRGVNKPALLLRGLPDAPLVIALRA